MGFTVVRDAASQWGYDFGIDGVLSPDAASALMANCCERTLQRRVIDGKIRRGKEGARVVYCKRSVMSYIASLEQ